MLMVIKMSLILGTLLGITHQWSAILENGSLNWLAWLISYVLCFVVFYFWDKHNKKHIDTEPVDAPLGSVSAAHHKGRRRQLQPPITTNISHTKTKCPPFSFLESVVKYWQMGRCETRRANHCGGNVSGHC